jgi:hypothetical protein
MFMYRASPDGENAFTVISLTIIRRMRCISTTVRIRRNLTVKLHQRPQLLLLAS